MKKPDPIDWEHIAEICYRSRRGTPPSRAESDLIDDAYRRNPKRYIEASRWGRDRADAEVNPLSKKDDP